MNNEYILFWKESDGQQVSTVVDAHNNPVVKGYDYLTTNNVQIVYSPEHVFEVLNQADGVKYATPREVARQTLGWDV